MEGLVSSLKTSVPASVLINCVAIGNFDLDHPVEQVAFGCEGGKVLLYRLDELSKLNQPPFRTVNVKEEIKDITPVQWIENSTQTYLIIASSTNVQLYDITKNVSLFHRSLDDGINTIKVGWVAEKTDQWLLVGGESSITGFDQNGLEVYWNVASDSVAAICFADLTSKGHDQIVVGTADFEISLFDCEELIDSRTEVAAIELLTRISHNSIAYASSNGTIGVYQNLERLWRVKSKSVATCQTAYPDKGCLLTGWRNGRWEMRRVKNGEILFKSQMSNSIANILLSPVEGEQSLMVIDTGGNVELFKIPTAAQAEKQIASAKNDLSRRIERKRETLSLELKTFDKTAKTKQLSIGECVSQSAIPAAAKIESSLRHQKNGLFLDISVNLELKIYLAILLSDGMFPENESKVEMATSGVSQISIPLGAHNSTQTEIMIKISVSYPGSKILHVLEDLVDIPKFAQYRQSESYEAPLGKAQFSINEREQRMKLWIKDNFILNSELGSLNPDQLRYSFVNQNNQRLNILMQNQQVLIESDSIKCASEVIQSMATFFSLKTLQSECVFDEVKKIPQMFDQIQSLQDSLSRIDGEIAEQGMLLMSYMVRLEDSRVLEDYDGMETAQSLIKSANLELLTKYQLKEQNKDFLMKLLRDLNSFIDCGSKLRVGKSSSEVLSVCRKAVKAKKPDIISNAILHGVQ